LTCGIFYVLYDKSAITKGNELQYTKCVSAIIVASTLYGQAVAGDDDLVGKDWGCAVLMCMMNPSGSTAEPKCKPPIDKLVDELAKGHGFPECEGVKENQVVDYFDPCPDGTAAAPAGSSVVTGVRTDRTVTITSIAKKSEVFTTARMAPSDRACVGAPVGMKWTVSGSDDTGTTLLVYSSAVWLKAYATPRAIDVYGTDGKLVDRVRY